MNNPKFESYKRPNGHNEFDEWLLKLSVKDRAKVINIIENTQKYGIIVAQKMKWVKKLRSVSNLYELRSRTSSNIQRILYFHAAGTRYVITHGFTKKTVGTPLKEITHAVKLRREWYENDQN